MTQNSAPNNKILCREYEELRRVICSCWTTRRPLPLYSRPYPVRCVVSDGNNGSRVIRPFVVFLPSPSAVADAAYLLTRGLLFASFQASGT